ncbi:hypothetical protein E2C01_066317 [Portunus trituberculatus]|uniref:Uncharacterized protein n=1 Tax=Portunus trituberculatus TaxID=210409 RepID=A0A5B7HUC1_PORTR|nr:hypothetical protein [Portunus trituberculatus]
MTVAHPFLLTPLRLSGHTFNCPSLLR